VRLSPIEHKQKAESNSKFTKLATGMAFDDWTFTACYYTFIHYLRSYLYAQGEFPAFNHVALYQSFNRLANQPAHGTVLSPLAPLYNLLYTNIRSVRYDQPDASWPVAIPKADIVAFARRTAPSALGFSPVA
jgi:hypothetical protein